MLYPHFQENYLPCSKFAIFLPTNFSEEPNSLTYETGSVPVFYWKCGVSAVDGAKSLLTSTDSLASLKKLYRVLPADACGEGYKRIFGEL